MSKRDTRLLIADLLGVGSTGQSCLTPLGADGAR